MVAERRASIPESLAYLALFFSILRPDLQEQIKLDQTSINPLEISSSPYNLTGLAFSTPYSTSNKCDTVFPFKGATAGMNYDPLSQYLNWQNDARFDADAVALIFGDSAPRTQLRSLDSESGYSSDDAKSPSSPYSHSETDLSDLGAAGYTPNTDLSDLINSLEDYVDIDSFQTYEPHKGILDVQDSNHFDFSGYDLKQGQDFYPNKLSPSENLLYSPEYKTSPDGSDFQDSLGMELENKFFDPLAIDFENSFTNNSYQFGNDLDTEIDLDSLASLDFSFPLDILTPTQEENNQIDSPLTLPLQEPVTTRINTEYHHNIASTSLTTDDGVKSPAISLPAPYQRNGEHTVKGIASAPKQVTATKSKSLKTDDLPFGLSEQKVVEMAVSEFNIFLEKLSKEEAKIVKDIRRRGKNKEAARVCRKRKIEAIDSLDDDLQMMNNEKKRILEEQRAIKEETASLKSKIKELENSVISSLRDENGRPLSANEYSIFQGGNGALYVGKTITDKGKKQESS